MLSIFRHLGADDSAPIHDPSEPFVWGDLVWPLLATLIAITFAVGIVVIGALVVPTNHRHLEELPPMKLSHSNPQPEDDAGCGAAVHEAPPQPRPDRAPASHMALVSRAIPGGVTHFAGED